MENILSSHISPKASVRSFFAKAKLTNGIHWLYLVNLLAVLSGYTYLINSLGQLPEKVPFFYTLPWGEGQLAPSYYLWGLADLALAIFLINLILSVIELSRSNFTLSRFYGYV